MESKILEKKIALQKEAQQTIAQLQQFQKGIQSCNSRLSEITGALQIIIEIEKENKLKLLTKKK